MILRVISVEIESDLARDITWDFGRDMGYIMNSVRYIATYIKKDRLEVLRNQT